jgi:hypothetical protein
MILYFHHEPQDTWEWIQWALGEFSHPLNERFKTYDRHPVLVSLDELDLIIEAVEHTRADWDDRSEEIGDDENVTKEDEEERERMIHDLDRIDETLDFLNQNRACATRKNETVQNQ